MTIKLFGRLSSANVQKATWVLEEIGVDYEVLERGGKFGGLDTPEYLALNPNGLVPTLQDGDLIVWESHAIVRYLSAQYASGLLWPVEAIERAKVDQWTDWAATTFQPAWINVFWNVVRTPKSAQDDVVIAQSVAKTHALFAILDAQLAKTPYMGGSGFTYADIVIGVAMYRWSTMEIERMELPHVEAWHQKLLRRPAFVKAVNVSYAELVGRGRA